MTTPKRPPALMAALAMAVAGGFPALEDEPKSAPGRKDRADPVQAEKIRKAEEKRERKAKRRAG